MKLSPEWQKRRGEWLCQLERLLEVYKNNAPDTDCRLLAVEFLESLREEAER